MIMIMMETNVLHFLIINAAILLREPVNTTNNLLLVAFIEVLKRHFLGIVCSTSQMHFWWK